MKIRTFSNNINLFYFIIYETIKKDPWNNSSVDVDAI